jgi:gliding motility-associated-like protein
MIEPEELIVNINVLTDYFGLPVSCENEFDGQIQAIALGGTPGYDYSWNTNPVQSTQTIINLGVGSYEVTVTDLNGCSSQSQIILEANPIPTINPTPPVSACLGEEVTFSANSLQNENCEWFLSNGQTITDCGPNTVLFSTPGCIDVSLVISNNFGCSDTSELVEYICIWSNPVADFVASDYETSIINPDIQFTNLSQNASYYFWEFGDGVTSTQENPLHFFPGDIAAEYIVQLIAENDEGCADTITKIVSIKKELVFYVPNTFTPDFDDYNQDFKPVFSFGGANLEEYQFYIFNRWGELIWESYDPNVGWDGTYGVNLNTKVQDGTYTWKLIVKSKDDTIDGGKKQLYHGHVNVIK